MAKRTRKKANLTSVAEPQMVTLTKSPANHTGFKVMRSTTEGKEEEVKRNDLISIDLPEGITRDEADELASAYGMTEDYEIVENGAAFSLVRKTSDDAEVQTTAIPMGEGLVANIAITAFQRSDATEETKDDKVTSHKSITLVSVRFDEDHYEDAKQVMEWLDNHGIDYPENGVVQNDDSFLVQRGEVQDDSFEVKFDTGVTGLLCRSDELNVPQQVYRSVIEQAYGNWGWWHLDFAQAVADVEFSDRSWDALYALRDVLENIIFYSDLDLDARKQLITNATEGYAAYMSGLIDSLPTGVIEQVRSDMQASKQEADMAGKKVGADSGKQDQAKRSAAKADDQASVDAALENAGSEAPAADDQQSEFVTRSELTDILNDVLDKREGKGGDAAADDADAEAAQRSDDTDAGEPAAAAEDAEAAEPTMKDLVGAMTKLADTVNGMGEQMSAMRSDVDSIADGTVITRSDDATGDDQGSDDEPRDVFSGMFGRAK